MTNRRTLSALDSSRDTKRHHHKVNVCASSSLFCLFYCHVNLGSFVRWTAFLYAFPFPALVLALCSLPSRCYIYMPDRYQDPSRLCDTLS